MESMEKVFDSNISETDARHNQSLFKRDGREANTENVQVFSVDKVTIEKIVLESSSGSREVLLTKNESSRKFSLSCETKNVTKLANDNQEKSTRNDVFPIPEDAFAFSKPKDANFKTSKLPIPKSRKSVGASFPNEESRIKPIKFTKKSPISSIVIDGLNSTNIIAKRNKVPPKVPEKTAIKKENNSSSIVTSVSFTEKSEDLSPNRDKVVDKILTAIKQEQSDKHKLFGTEDVRNDKKNDNNINFEKHNEISKIANVQCDKLDKVEKQNGAINVKKQEKNAKIDSDAQSYLEKSQTTIEELQKNLSTKIHANTAQSYKEKLLDVQASYTPGLSVTAESSGSERLSSGFDKDFLEKHNLDKRLKIEEKRLLETDLDYTSDNDRTSETEDQPKSRKIDIKQKYSEKVTEVEKRWSGGFLENRLQRNSSGSSKSSYIEEFGSASSRESIVDDRRYFFGQKHPEKFTERQTSIDESKTRTSEEILENSTVSTVDSDSCLEDRIKAVDEDIAHVTNEIQTNDNDDIDGFDQAYGNEEVKDCNQWNEEVNTILTTTAVICERKNQNLKEEKSINDTTGVNNYNDTKNSNRVNRVKNNYKKNINVIKNKKHLIEQRNDKENHRNRDGYANLIREFAMEAGSSKMLKKEEKQKKRLGFRRLLPAIFSPKDSRKEYKKKEQKERRRYDERHFARYQQNGNYTRSPDTMNLNEDIKRNVKLDNSLNGSIIDERLDEIKRELFPEQGPITSTPDHFLQTDDTRLLCDRRKNQRSYTTDSSLSSIAPDERWIERGGQFVISPDIRKYEQRQKREEHDGRRYNYLERKHSLQESNHGSRNYVFQRNHASSGRISAPPNERYLRPRAVFLVDRPLPEIPQSRLELSNYENYKDGIGQLCDDLSSVDVVDNKNYQNQSGLYQNNGNLEANLLNTPQSVPAQVKITRQPIVNQTQRAPLIGRTSKNPSSGSSQKSGDYADSSCTPNSSQKSEFSPSSSKSGEYYLNSPRSSARTSPTEQSAFEDGRERIYENEAQPVISQSSINYAEEHIYDKTPSPCREKHFSSTKASDHMTENSPEKKDNLIYEEKCLSNRQSPVKNCSFQHSCEGNENIQAESKREIEKTREKSCLKNHETQFDTNLKSDSITAIQTERTSIQNVSPSKQYGTMTIVMSPSAGSRTRRSQPNDQILIASPKREIICQSRVSRPSNETRLCESPIPIADSHEGISGIVPIEVRHQYGGQNPSVTGIRRSIEQKTISSFGLSKSISRPEPIYGYRRQQTFHKSDTTTLEPKEDKREKDQLPSDPYSSTESCRDVDERVARIRGQSSELQNSQSCSSEAKQLSDEPGRRAVQSPIRESTQSFCQQSSPTTNQDKRYTSANALEHESIYEQRQRQHQPRQGQEPLYAQRIADATSGQQSHSTYMLLSPSKQETRQHLEAFYWQQKALEAHRKSAISSANSGPKQNAAKIDLPEMREAVYWQQLKRLDEEQQRRIYERNATEDRLYETYNATRMESPVATMISSNANQMLNSKGATTPALVHGDRLYWSNVQQRLKTSPTGKLPLMQIQKGQNQPVLIVRPQQALRDRQEMSMKSMNPAGHDAQRSKSASPHFHRGDIERASFNVTYGRLATNETTGISASPRKPEASEIHEEDGNEDKPRPPHPIFKRGSLIGGESVEYGSTGPKRVSFSNQPKIGPDLATGSWPTKHGTAPEPPTRRHKSENSATDTDSVYLHQDRRDANQDVILYGTGIADLTCRSNGSRPQREYDANRPLPPPPKDPCVISRRENSAKNHVCNEVSTVQRWNSEEQRGYQRRQDRLLENEYNHVLDGPPTRRTEQS
ncbi:hypothetical protein ACFW04_006932 [Cataglyphis niger]